MVFGFGKKKEDELKELEKELGLSEEIGKVPGAEEPKEEMPKPLPEEPERPAFKEAEMPQMPKPEIVEHKPEISARDLELLSAKLDSIRLMIDNMNDRIKHIEQMEEEEAKKRRRGW